MHIVIVVEDRFQEALDTPAKVAELSTQLKENIAEQITDDINEKVEEIWTTDKNYQKNTTNLENGEAPDGNLYEMSENWFSEADKVLGAVYNTSSAFLNKNDLFQLGWLKPGASSTDPAVPTIFNRAKKGKVNNRSKSFI